MGLAAEGVSIVWTPGDPSDLARTQEDRWNHEREATSLRRLARTGKTQGPISGGLLRALLAIEHKFYSLACQLPQRRLNTVHPDPVSDAELVHLLALLAHDGNAVRVQPL